MNAQTSSFDISRGAAPWVIGFVAVLAVAGLGSAFPPDGWYAALDKPTWQPPSWLFAPVWGTLYLMLGCALALLIKSPRSRLRSVAIGWFIAQLVLNAAWTPVFFGMHAPLMALVVISTLWCVLIATMSSAFKVSSAAGWLVVPTFVWVSFALVLNGVIAALNA